MSTYFHLEDEFEKYSHTYNDEFEQEKKLMTEIETVFGFIDQCNFYNSLRVWKNSDLFTLLVEFHRAIVKEERQSISIDIAPILTNFYQKVDLFSKKETAKIPKRELEAITNYYKATQFATNNRGNRITRGEIIRNIILAS